MLGIPSQTHEQRWPCMARTHTAHTVRVARKSLLELSSRNTDDKNRAWKLCEGKGVDRQVGTCQQTLDSLKTPDGLDVRKSRALWVTSLLLVISDFPFCFRQQFQLEYPRRRSTGALNRGIFYGRSWPRPRREPKRSRNRSPLGNCQCPKLSGQ